MCLPKMTPFKIVLPRPIVGVMKSFTVSRTSAGNFFASILCEIDMPEKTKRCDKEQGLDGGLKSFVVTSEGEKIDPPKNLRKSEKKLAQLQRELARKKPGSTHRNRERVKAARLHEHIANQRKDFTHKLSHRLIRERKAIYVEGLNVKGMLADHPLAQSISDANGASFCASSDTKANGTAAGWKRLTASSRQAGCGVSAATIMPT